MKKGQHVRKHRRRYSRRAGSFRAGRGIGKPLPLTQRTERMTPSRVKHYEAVARRLMKFNDKFEAEYNVDKSESSFIGLNRKYQYRLYNELQKLGWMRVDYYPEQKMPSIYYNIFEDANYHFLNDALGAIHAFERSKPWADVAEYNAYRKKGGRTWSLT